MHFLKKLLIVILSLMAVMSQAQELKVVEFRADMSMTDAVQYPKEDFNGDRCGLIRLGLVLPDATFEGNIISLEYKDGEWWIYMAKDANWITIKSTKYLPLRYEFEEIQSNVTYVMNVEVPYIIHNDNNLMLYADGFSLILNGKTLSEHEIRKLFANSKSLILYNKGIRMCEEEVDSFYDGYYVYTIAGLVVDGLWGLVGLMSSNTSSPDDIIAYYNKSKWVLYGGTALFVSGFVLPYIKYVVKNSIGKAKIRKAVNLYNNGKMYSQNKIEMEYGLSGNGVYLSFWF